MQNNIEVTGRTAHTSLSKILANEAMLTKLVNVFTTIWERSKNDPNYKAILGKECKSFQFNNSAVSYLRRAAIKRRILIPVTTQFVRFRPDIARPNLLMIQSLVEDALQLQNELTTSSIKDFKDEDLISELRRRGITVKATKTITQIIELWK